MIDSDWHLELMSLGVINLISNACGAALGFGGNILFHICYSCCKTFDVFIHEGYELGFCSGDLKSVVFYITISSFSLSIIQSMTLHCDINWPLALQLGVSQQLGIAIGQFLLNTMETQWLGKILGAVFFALAIQMAYEEVSHFSKAAMKRSSDVASRLPELQESKRTEGEQENEKKKKMTILILGVGTLSGVLSGLFSTGGPPLIWLVSYLKLETSRDTSNGLCCLPDARCRLDGGYGISGRSVIRESTTSSRYIHCFLCKCIIRKCCWKSTRRLSRQAAVAVYTARSAHGGCRRPFHARNGHEDINTHCRNCDIELSMFQLPYQCGCYQAL
jgi:hypothetical protein